MVHSIIIIQSVLNAITSNIYDLIFVTSAKLKITQSHKAVKIKSFDSKLTDSINRDCYSAITATASVGSLP